MATATITISLDDESKDLIRQLVEAVKALHEPVNIDTTFGDPPKRLVEPSPFQHYRPMSDVLVEIVEPVIGKDNPSLQAMKAVGDRYIEQHGTPVVKDDDYLLPTEHHEGEDTE